MWLTSFMAKNIREHSAASSGSVMGTKDGRLQVDATLSHHDLPLIAPFGVMYVPVTGEKAVTLETPSGEVCLGVVAKSPKELASGELMLCSKGGASIVLKNDGRVLINGKEF
ncbi:MAG: hypothetical protein IJD93_06285 [Ruminococcus sp.]|nr:hypothetical protein [Ruminococcus sp.]